MQNEIYLEFDNLFHNNITLNLIDNVDNLIDKIGNIDINLCLKLQEILLDERLWNRNTIRTEHSLSPHHELSDIHLRWTFNDEPPVIENDLDDIVWKPIIKELLIVYEIVDEFSKIIPEEILGILLTKIPSGKWCKPHVDAGLHAERTEKYCVCIKANSIQKFTVGSKSLSSVTGDVFKFRNDILHDVTNNSNEERISLIICVRKSL